MMIIVHHIMHLIGICIALALLAACSSAPTVIKSERDVNYQLLLSGQIDGRDFQGIGVGSVAPNHTITIQSAVPVPYFTVQSCHRSIQFNDVIQPKPWYQWQKDNKGFTWNYDQAPTIEDNGNCILRFCAFSKTPGAAPVACAIVDFKNERFTLPSENICNGSSGSATGTSICHTQVGLIQRMRFPVPVVVAPKVQPPENVDAPYWIKDQCVGRFLDEAQTLFEYEMPLRECYVIFMEKVGKPRRRAKLTVIPYDKAQYFGGQ